MKFAKYFWDSEAWNDHCNWKTYSSFMLGEWYWLAKRTWCRIFGHRPIEFQHEFKWYNYPKSGKTFTSGSRCSRCLALKKGFKSQRIEDPVFNPVNWPHK